MSASSTDAGKQSGSVYLRLRDDLVFTPLPAGARSWSCQIEDRSRARFFQIGLAEYTFISLLDGKTTIREACQLAQKTTEAASLSETDAARIASWVLQLGLTTTTSQRNELSFENARAESEPRDTGRNWNPLFFRIPVGSPDGTIRKLLPLVSWIYGPVGAAIWFVLVIAGVCSIGSNWNRFANESTGILATDNWPWLIGVWLVLKLIHEFSHATACRALGGRVGNMGVMMVLFAPLAYVDVTSSWRFPSRWQRILVAFSGMYAELAVAAVAAIVWANVDSEIVRHRLYNVVLVGGVSTLLFNANPLVRADGYFILTDLCGIPNLQTLALKELRGLLSVVIRSNNITSPYSTRTRLLLALFGMAIWCWRVTVYTCFALTAGSFYHGAGIVVVAAAILFIAFSVIMQMRKGAQRQSAAASRGRLTRLAAVGTVVSLLTGVGMVISWQSTRSAPGIVRHTPHASVRTQVDGFLTELAVRNNDVVKKGDLLATFTNDTLSASYNMLHKEVETAKLNCQLLMRQKKMAEYRVEQERLAGLTEQLEEKSQEMAGLSLRAPIDGRVAARQIESRLQTYFKEGSALCVIEGDDAPELRISVSQRDVAHLSLRTGQDVNVRIPGIGKLQGRLRRVAPKGSDTVTMPELSVAEGGSLPVAQQVEPKHDKGAAQYRLLEPRFDAIVELSVTPQLLLSGQLGTAYWMNEAETLGDRLSSALSEWVRKKMRR